MRLALGLMLFSLGGPSEPVTPVLTSLEFDLIPAGESITFDIVGSGFTGATDVQFDASSSSFLVINDSLITVSKLLSAGTYDVTVIGPGGTSNALPIEAWSPLQITGVDSYLDSSKDVTVSGSDVTSWLEQSRSAAYAGGGGSNNPLQVASVFGAKPAVRFSRPGGASGATWVAGSSRSLASGKSIFWVGYLANGEADTIPNNAAENPPYTVVGDLSAGHTATGYTAGQLTNTSFNGGGYDHVDRGSGLNDGVCRLQGLTHSTGGDVKAYVGTVQQGATATGITVHASSDYEVIGCGLSNTDGFVGDLGAVIVVSGVISGGDLTKLHAWARASFGAAA